MVAIIMDNIIGNSVESYDMLHSFQYNWGMGEASLEAKLMQQLAAMW